MVYLYFILSLCGFAFWYLLKWIDMHINGGASIFDNFILELSWLFSQNRKNYIKNMVLNGEGFLFGHRKSWSYEEVREKENYLEVADEMLPSRSQIIFYNLVLLLIPIFPLLHATKSN